jgi:hypothetical protein
MLELEKVGDIRVRYPKQWIVITNLEWAEGEASCTIGLFHSAHDDRDIARAIRKGLPADAKETMVTEGFNDSPEIGGVMLCVNQ